MKRAFLFVLALSIAAAAPASAEPVIALHVTPRAVIPCGSGRPEIPCSEFVTRGSLSVGYSVYVVAARASTVTGVGGAAFGIDYDGSPGSGVDIFGWYRCADFEFPGNGWPGAGGGNVITYTPYNCQYWVPLGTDGVHAVLGAFYVYAYGDDELEITPRQNVGSSALTVVDCYRVERDILLEDVGRARFSSDPFAQGYNPCTGDDITPPVLIAASGEAGSSEILVEFSEPVGLGADVAANYRVVHYGTVPDENPVVVAAQPEVTRVTLTLDRPLVAGGDYGVYVTNVRDYAGNSVRAGAHVRFQVAVPDVEAPRLFFARGVGGASSVDVYFTEPVTSGAGDPTNYRVTPGPNGAAEFPILSVAPGTDRATLALDGTLAYEASYTVTVNNVADAAGNVIAPNSSLAFTTGADPVDRQAPVLLSASGGVSGNRVALEFSEAVGAGADTPANFRISPGPNGEPEIPVVSAEPLGSRVALTLSGALRAGITYTAAVSNVQDLAGNAIAPGASVQFVPASASLHNPVIALHLSSHHLKSQCTVYSPESRNCADFVVDGETQTPYDLYVVVVDPGTRGGIAGAQFGIAYSPAVSVYMWTKCADLEFPGQGWPASGGGNTITWHPDLNCQTWDQYGDGVRAVAGYFYLYAYGGGTFSITPRNIAVPDLRVADCLGVEYDLWAGYEAGIVGFPWGGFNPCLWSPPVPVERSTWGAIKRTYGLAPGD